MEMIINGHNVHVHELPTNIYGLKFLPQMGNGYDNDKDYETFTKFWNAEVSKRDYDLVDSVSQKYMTHGIMEIGISRNGDGSFTHAMLKNKPKDILYLGVDIEDKSYLDNSDENIYTIKEDSFNRNTVIDYAKKIGLNKISILFIDGWHSLNAVINDWQYVELLSDNGIIIFHDTNSHPGPTVFIECIDKDLFEVEKYFSNMDDYGVTIVYKKRQIL